MRGVSVVLVGSATLDTGEIASGRDVGAAGVFSPEVDGRRLTLGVRISRLLEPLVALQKCRRSPQTAR